MTAAETVSVLTHECAHEFLHKGTRRAETTKTVRETEAEAVAFVVCHAIGLDTGTQSSDYIQLWQGDKTTLSESLQFIQATAVQILTAIGASGDGPRSTENL
jgi:hypothetical protein